MKQYSCTGCGFRHRVGYLFDQPAIGLCRSCRDIWLTYLRINGFVMADTTWIVNELCEDSHHLPDVSWRYYDCVSQQGTNILRLRK